MNHHLLITMDYPPVKGGISVYLSNLWDHVAFKRSLLMAKGGKPYPYPAKYDIAYSNLPTGKSFLFRGLRVCLMLPLLAFSLLGKKNLVLHCGQLFVCGLPAAFISLFKKLDYVVYIYAADAYACQKRFFRRALLLLIVKRAKLVVTISEYSKNLLIETGAEAGKIALVSPGVDMYLTCPETTLMEMRNKLKPNDSKIILTLARLVRRKGHETILNALPEIIKIHPNLIWVVAGEGPYKSVIEKQVQSLRLQSNVRLIGPVSDEEKCALYRLCDLFALVPFEDKEEIEGFGIVYLEAAFFSKPVVGSLSGGIPDAVENNVTGLLIPPLDEKALVAAIQKLLFDKAFSLNMGDAGKKRLSDFTWDKKAAALEDALKQKALL